MDAADARKKIEDANPASAAKAVAMMIISRDDG
jgi:hypothetical protein